MEPLFIGLIAIGCLIALIMVGLPIFFSMLIVGFVGLSLTAGPEGAVALAGSTMYHAVANWLYIVIPMFVLMGEFAGECGIIEDMYTYFKSVFRRVRGSLAMVTVAVGALLSLATGSNLAEVALMSRMSLPEMDKNGYDRKFSLENILGGGMLGNLIPPSIGLTLYGIITETSIGKLMIGAMVPSFMMAGFNIVYIAWSVKRRPELAPVLPAQEKLGFIAGIQKMWALTVLGLLVIGGIYVGLFTATEAAAIGAIGAFLIGLVKRTLSWKKTIEVLERSLLLSAMIMVLLASAAVFSKFLGVVGFVNVFTQSIIQMNLSPIWLFLVMYLIFMFFGCFVDSTSLLLLLTPIFFPLVVKLGYDPIWFGMILLMLIQIGQILPPIGMAVYVLAHVSGTTPEKCFSAARNIIFLYIFGLILFSVWPGLTLWLVHRMWGT